MTTLVYCRDCKEPVCGKHTGEDFVEKLQFSKSGHHKYITPLGLEMRKVDDGILIVFDERKRIFWGIYL